ncbi:MAG TPA: pyridoxamine 5'-phosphate oxidase family protein [Pseudorhizobium sp.]|nr:pyridoxamine 5'-phosphate oxidase family protein [Pseudorhizobium sp.]
MTSPPQDRPQVLRETDDEARRLSRSLIHCARHMSLAVMDPETGFPSVSRALTAPDLDGVPVVLVSALSSHTRGLVADPRCSLLAGEPSKGDPLAHSRITLQCVAAPVEKPGGTQEWLRERFLDYHPKAALYVDFPDFRFFRLTPRTASLNGGFGRAYLLSPEDITLQEVPAIAEWQALQRKLRDLPQVIRALAGHLFPEKDRNWRFSGVDPLGFDLTCGDLQFRHEFQRSVSTAADAFYYISSLSGRNAQGIPSPEN